MTSITIRHLDGGLKHRLCVRAAEHGRSMKEEVREILRQVVGGPALRQNLVAAVRTRFAPFAGDGLEIPPREPMRDPHRPSIRRCGDHSRLLCPDVRRQRRTRSFISRAADGSRRRTRIRRRRSLPGASATSLCEWAPTGACLNRRGDRRRRGAWFRSCWLHRASIFWWRRRVMRPPSRRPCRSCPTSMAT